MYSSRYMFVLLLPLRLERQAICLLILLIFALIIFVLKVVYNIYLSHNCLNIFLWAFLVHEARFTRRHIKLSFPVSKAVVPSCSTKYVCLCILWKTRVSELVSRLATLSKKKLRHRCFRVSIMIFLRTLFIEHLQKTVSTVFALQQVKRT